MLLLGILAAAVAAGEMAFGGLGLGSAILFAACLGAMRIAFRFERRPAWVAIGVLPDEIESGIGRTATEETRSSLSLAVPTVLLAAVILIAGTFLSFAGDEIAGRTGIGDGLVGLLLLAIATSLPEVGSVWAAVRLRRYELAIGQVFGSNLFNLSIIFLIDIASPTGPVLGDAGRFEIVAAMLGLTLTGIFVVGLLERRDRMIFRMGYDSLAALVVYGMGAILLMRLVAE
jgi:cation:H+ antiporter